MKKFLSHALIFVIGVSLGAYKGMWFYKKFLDHPEVVNNNSTTTEIGKLKTKGKNNEQITDIENTPNQNIEQKKKKTKKGKMTK